MAGHSEWSNIKHRKQKQDKKKAKLFGRLVKEIMSEARKNPDPDDNPTLASAIERAHEANMPKENIEKAIKRATGELEDVEYEIHLYEGYGPAGIALIIRAETDNRNRTSTALKNIFKDHGGELGEAGCVRWMFERKGVLMAPKDGLGGGDLDQLQLQAIDAGAERIEEKEEELKFYCPPDDLQAVSGSLQRSCPELEQDLVLVPKSTVDPAPSAREQCEGLIESLEENDDVQDIYSNLN